MTWRGDRRRRAADGAEPRKPARRGTYVVRQRLRLGGLVSGVLLVGGLAALAAVVLTLPWWITAPFREAEHVGDVLIGLFAALIVLGLPAMVATLAGLRTGNAALRRRVLAMDVTGVWVYPSARWWRNPYVVRWHQAAPVRAFTLEYTPGGGDQTFGPTLVPWDYVAFGEPVCGATVHLLWLTATVEEIVAETRLRCPELVFRDERTPPPPGIGGWVLRRRRAGPPFRLPLRRGTGRPFSP
ncbi:hypothetical protein DVA86_05380 [Streptomyces armeniacus]|uniref:Uncharacterized protein n=1 Tax=Streptomyces armeniacus TaxID=83291 RepID=A0A345XKK3_9ACTN|nr:hypothetical protein [Streptomyces armeniacus]AXK32169.1 hypothetical protein DVA86_05380 [Streptomyces armeniacus]